MKISLLVYWIATFLLCGKCFAQNVVIACVDCFSSASLLPQFAAEIAPDANIKWIVIKTYKYAAETHEKSLSAFPQNSEVIEVNPNNQAQVSDLLDSLRKQGVSHILGGTDQGAFHASEWNSKLGLPDNDFRLRTERRQKLAQAAVVNSYGIPTFMLSDKTEAQRFIEENVSDGQRVVFKLNNGAASVGLKIVPKPVALKMVDELVKGAKGSQGEIDRYVVQPEIIGQEYYIQTFSHGGRTVITGLWMYIKGTIGDAHVYFVDRPLSLFSNLAKELRPIVSSINSALGLTEGPAHIEMINEPTGRWKLIENNGRLAGSGIPGVEHQIYGLSQLDLWLLSILKPERFEKAFDSFPRRLEKDAFLFMIPSPYPGNIDEDGLNEIYKLKTTFFPADQYQIKAGKFVDGPTRDLNTIAFVLHAIGSTPELKKDFEQALGVLTSGRLIRPTQSLSCVDAMHSTPDYRRHLIEISNRIPWNFHP